MIERISAATAAPSSARATEYFGASATRRTVSPDGWSLATVQAEAGTAPSAEPAVEAETSTLSARRAAEDIAARNMLDSLSSELRVAGGFYAADDQAASQSFFATLYDEA
ncbi:hypothetical protein E2F50_09975 [Rhizobium deserti]|uniref:Uncharacterized protein n=1 Tax=Rhizobium deserti TaxID=2547961 RepID=A0A4R5UJZ3_9HYPH|nr:hypothetical protein [Rhizobium deserti]TDK37207.1 hypothetical protein E2F50_09975 [Rhizobium deserti]